MAKPRQIDIQRELVSPILPFLIKPYLQVGGNADFGSENYLELVWHLSDYHHSLSVEIKYLDSNQWRVMPVLEAEKLKIEGIKKHYRYKSILSDLRFGKEAQYRILWRGYTVFATSFRTPKGSGQAMRFAVVGDLADGGNEVKEVAHRIYESHPDICLIAGDVTYKNGRVSEYLENFFPVLNSTENDPQFGAPLMRSVPTMVAWGNHDVRIDKKSKSRKRRSNSLGIDLFFSQPQNGPSIEKMQSSLTGESGQTFKKITQILGDDFLSRSNYSFKMGNALFVVIDGNEYMDWLNLDLRLWLSHSLSRSDCIWKFVFVHHPPFNIDKKYWNQQHLRVLSGIFEQHSVDVVFSGHSHMYGRTHPLRFHAESGSNGKFIQEDGQVNGSMAIGQGPTYIITGAGGKTLKASHSPNLDKLPNFFAFADTQNRSISVCELDGKKFSLRQISAGGAELDSITIEK